MFREILSRLNDGDRILLYKFHVNEIPNYCCESLHSIIISKRRHKKTGNTLAIFVE